jgi:hypothetical protein
MSLLSSAVRNLSASLKHAGGEATTYRRGNDSIDGVIGVPVRTRHDDYATEDDLALTARERDWIYLAEDLAIGGEQLSPQRGDFIDWVDPLGVTHTYQVLPRSDDRCFRHTDPTMQMLRCYTVEALPSSE